MALDSLGVNKYALEKLGENQTIHDFRYILSTLPINKEALYPQIFSHILKWLYLPFSVSQDQEL